MASKSELSAGTFYYDWSARRIYTGLDPSTKTSEITVRPVAMVLSNKGRASASSGSASTATPPTSSTT